MAQDDLPRIPPFPNLLWTGIITVVVLAVVVTALIFIFQRVA